MIVLVQDDPAGYSVEGSCMLSKIFVLIPEREFFRPVNIFTNAGYAETAIIIGPVIAMFLHNMRIDEYLLDPRRIGIGIFTSFLFIHIRKDLRAVDHKEPNVAIDLRSRQSYSVAGIHGFPHVLYQLRQ